MQYRMIAFVLVIVVATIAFSGCINVQAPAGAVTQTPSSGTRAASTGGGLYPSPTDTMPDNQAVTVDVGEKDYLGAIPVIFQGGLGQVNVHNIDVRLTRFDGTTQTATLGLKKGDTIELEGTRGSGSLTGQPDRVEVWVTTNSGQTYKIIDKLVEYRTRG
jgi:hypothetical protein